MSSQVNHSPSPDSENPSVFDHVYQAYDSVSKKAGVIAGTAASQAQRLYEKADELKNRYFTADFIKTKTKQTIIAKVLPLSTPQDLEKQIEKTTKEIKFLSKVKSQRESKLSQINERIADISQQIEKDKALPSKKKNLEKSLEFQKDLQINCKDQIAAAKKGLKNDQDILDYLDFKKKSTIGGRFTGWAGWVSDMAMPGSGRVVGTTLTAMNLLAQQNSINILPDNPHIRSEEQRRTLLGVATTISSLAFATFAMPILKEAAGTVWRSWYPLSPFY